MGNKFLNRLAWKIDSDEISCNPAISDQLSMGLLLLLLLFCVFGGGGGGISHPNCHVLPSHLLILIFISY